MPSTRSVPPLPATKMELPRFYGLVGLVALLGAIIGCISGVVVLLGGFSAIQYVGVKWAAIGSGLGIIIASLAWLGVVECFLTIVQAQVDTRNAIIDYVGKQI